MSFQFQIADLAKQKFKAPVCMRVATNSINDAGKTVIAEAHFVGLFQCVPVDVARADMLEANRLRSEGTAEEVIAFSDKNLERDFIGIEPHPKHPFPFMDGDQPAPCTPETIKVLMKSKEFREAVSQAYQDARDRDVIGKNSKK